jgi:hypothetical protein
MGKEILEWIGYTASVIIVLSMLMNSIQKLRWINLFGAALFSLYGFLIKAYPVGFLNGFIVAIDIFYLYKMYSAKEYFRFLEVRNDNKYLDAFIDFHLKDIRKYFPEFEFNPQKNKISLLILRNMNVAGVILAHEYDNKTLNIGLDYVIPEYRDQKPGKFVYKKNLYFFSKLGYEVLCSKSQSKSHDKYLKKMGFIKGNLNNSKEEVYYKRLIF